MTDDAEQFAPWRQTDLIGHDEAERRLLDSFVAGQVPHAWLLTGPRGIGKATLAYRFARFLLAQPGARAGRLADCPASLAVPEEHQAAHLVANRSHPDLFAIEREIEEKTKRRRTEIVVPQIRALNRFFGLTSFSGWRVAVIDCADEMNTSAANALLKTLEEPPPRSVILLVGHAPGRLLPTVRSRCRRLVLHPLAVDDVVNVMLGQLPDLDETAARSLALLAEGSPGRALNLANEGGFDLYQDLIKLTDSLPRVPFEQVHALSDRLNRRDNDQSYRLWADLFPLWLARNIRRAAAPTADPGADLAADEAVPGEWGLARRLARSGNLDRWVDLWEKVGRLTAQAGGLNLERKQVVLNAFVALETTAREQFS